MAVDPSLVDTTAIDPTSPQTNVAASKAGERAHRAAVKAALDALKTAMATAATQEDVDAAVTDFVTTTDLAAAIAGVESGGLTEGSTLARVNVDAYQVESTPLVASTAAVGGVISLDLTTGSAWDIELDQDVRIDFVGDAPAVGFLHDATIQAFASGGARTLSFDPDAWGNTSVDLEEDEQHLITVRRSGNILAGAPFMAGVTIPAPTAISTTTLDIKLGTHENDLWYTSDGITLNDTGVALYTGGGRNAVLRYALPIPPGRTVESASLVFSSRVTSAETVVSTIDVLEADDAALPATGAEAVTAEASLTGSGVTWTQMGQPANGVTAESPDLASLIQSIVDRPGYVQGNDLAFFIKSASTAIHEWDSLATGETGTTTTATVLRVTIRDA